MAQPDSPPSGLIKELGLDSRLESMLDEEWGIEELYPPQTEALPHSLSGKSLMLAAPTASGKSLVAYLTIVQRLISDLKGDLALYLVPLKALGSEKFDELKEIASKVDLKVGLAMGDSGAETRMIEDSDILVCTSEKLDSILRTRPELMERVRIVVSDEFHLLDNPERGPNLEIVLSRLRHMNPDTQVIALSATVGNAQNIAEWLDAELVSSDWRPVALQYGTITKFDRDLKLDVHRIDGPEDAALPESRSIESEGNNPLKIILEDKISRGEQMLIFVSTRASTKKEARELSQHILKILSKDRLEIESELKEGWDRLANGILGKGDTTETVRSLAKYLRGGVAFHHAGLSSKHRKIVEESFKRGEIFCIVATPTLAQGVNLPSRTVVIRDFKRWPTGELPVREILQMMGRAGRPKYDQRGESWILVRENDPFGAERAEKIADKYFHGKTEDIESKLSNREAKGVEEDLSLLTHVLSMIATGGTSDRDALGRFFSKTLLSKQLGKESLVERIDDVISWLVYNGMIERVGESDEVKSRIIDRGPEEESEEWEDELPSWAKAVTQIEGLELSSNPDVWRYSDRPRKGPAIFGFRKASEPDPYQQDPPESPTMEYRATSLGTRVTQLYLDPVSGRIIRDGLGRAMAILSSEDKFGQVTPLGLLHLASSTRSIRPLRLKMVEENAYKELLQKHESELLVQDVPDEECRMKNAKVLESWMEEVIHESIELDFGVLPGDLSSIRDSAERILYAMKRILADDGALISKDISAHGVLIEAIDETHQRVRNGCKADLLSLVSIKNVGRKRARQMVNNLGVSDIKDVASLTERDMQKLADLQGWSPRLVDGIVNTASRAARRRSR